MKINLGCGSQKNRNWIGLALNNANININFEYIERLPFEDNSVDTIMCSHLIEHLTDETNKMLMKESYRILKKDGIFRVLTPDLDMYIRYFLDNDYEKFLQFKTANGKRELIGSNISEKFVNQFASWCTLKPKVRKRYIKLNDQEFKEMVLKEFNNFSTQIDIENYIEWYKQLLPEKTDNIMLLHINAFNKERLVTFLREAGFNNINVSEYRQSKDKELNKLNWDHFPEKSIIIESYK